MTTGHRPRTETMLVFDGQSLNATPGPLASYPYKVMAALPPELRRADTWVNGCPWAALMADAGSRLHPYARAAGTTVLAMCGGQNDLLDGTNGRDLLDVEVRYAAAARSAGFDHVLNMTIVPSMSYDDAADGERLAHNELLRADVGGAFDSIVDLAARARLDDPTDPTYYFDGLHWAGPATTIVKDAVLPSLRSMLPA